MGFGGCRSGELPGDGEGSSSAMGLFPFWGRKSLYKGMGRNCRRMVCR